MLLRALHVSVLAVSTAQALSLSGLYNQLYNSAREFGRQHVLGGPSTEPAVRTPFVHQHGPRRRTGFVAFGDSYSAGIGTLADGKENECRQGNGAYPFLINTDLLASLDPNATTAFQWLSCTGSTTDDLLSGGTSSQIDSFNLTFGSPNASADFATLSIGGNDLGFFDVMNACVFRFYSFYSGTCESALAASDVQINSPEFEHRLSLVMMEILDKVQWEKRPWFIITVTGYTRFFNDETDACDDMSLGVWWRGPKLKRAVRQRMNKLVLDVNNKLRKGIEELNSKFVQPKVFFVDYDPLFDGHRFCEPDVIEPDYNRTDTWFFLPGGPDNAPNSTTPEQVVEDMVLPTYSPFADPSICLPLAEKSGDWGERALCYMAMAKQRDPTLRFASERFTTQNSMWYVPTYYGKTFHPRSLGHRVVRDKLYEIWEENGL